MLRKCDCMFAATLLWWSAVVSLAHGENIMLLNLLKDEEFNSDLLKPESIDSNLESDLISTYNFDEDNDRVVLVDRGEILVSDVTKPQLKQLEDEPSNLNNTKNLPILPFTAGVSVEKTETHPKNPTFENSHPNIFGKVEDDLTVTKGFATEFPDRSEEGELLYPFVKFCFDIIASFIQGVMRGIMSVGDISTTSKPTEVPTDYSKSSSRIRKRDLSNTSKSTETNMSNINKEIATISDIDVSNSLPERKEHANLQDQQKIYITEHPTELLTASKESKHLNKTKNIVEQVNLFDSASSVKKINTEQNDKNVVASNISDKELGENEKDFNIEQIRNDETPLHDMTSIPTFPVQEKSTATNTKKQDHDLDTTLNYSTEEENSSSLLLDDFMSKQNDHKLTEIIEKHFANSQLKPLPHEGEYNTKEETSIGTVIMITTGAVFVVLVLVFVGLAAVYKYGVRWTPLNVGRNHSGNQNPLSQRSTMA